MKLNVHQKVVVTDYGINKIGIITKINRKSNTHVSYNVMEERGVGWLCLRVDKPKYDVYINTKLTKLLTSKISSNIDVSGNWKTPETSRENILNTIDTNAIDIKEDFEEDQLSSNYNPTLVKYKKKFESDDSDDDE